VRQHLETRALLARTYDRLGAEREAQEAWRAARAVVEAQSERLRGEDARGRFRATRAVADVLAAASP
jgi:hypothetical protein